MISIDLHLITTKELKFTLDFSNLFSPRLNSFPKIKKLKMKKIISFFFLSAFLLISAKSFSQPWLPQPVNSPLFNAMEGTWVSDPYEFMGNSSTDVLTFTKILNGQYMQVDLKTTSPGFTYEAKEIITPGTDGSLTGAFYDIFAKGQKTITYTGSQDGNKINIMAVGSNSSRDIVIDGNTMVQKVVFTMGDKAGLPENKITITYKKQ